MLDNQKELEYNFLPNKQQIITYPGIKIKLQNTVKLHNSVKYHFYCIECGTPTDCSGIALSQLRLDEWIEDEARPVDGICCKYEL